MSNTGVAKFMQKQDGTHNRQVEVDGCKVLVSGDDDARCESVAAQIARLAEGLERDRVEINQAKAEARHERSMRTLEANRRAEAEAKVPAAPQRIMGPSVVRTDERGRLWVMSNREQGWSSWGFLVDDWDEIFRRWRLRVDGVGADEHGPYVAFVPEPDRVPR